MKKVILAVLSIIITAAIAYAATCTVCAGTGVISTGTVTKVCTSCNGTGQK